MTDQPSSHCSRRRSSSSSARSSPSPCCSGLAGSSASTPSCRSAPAACTCCSAKWSACWTSRACISCPAKLGPAAFVDQLAGQLLRARPAARPGVPAQPAGELGRRRAHGDRHLVRDVDQRSGVLPVQEHRSARLAARQREQRHGALPEQHAAGGNAGNAPQHEPDGARRSHRQIAGVGLSARVGLHPQSAFPRCRHDPADRREGGEPSAPGDLRHQAGGRQPGERDHQFGRTRSRRRIRQSGGHPSGHAGAGASRRSPANPAVAEALFDVLETQRILGSSAKIALLPGGPHGRMLANLMAAEKQG